MNDQMLIPIVKQIAIDFAYTPGLQINTFGVMRGNPELNSDTLGYDYQDYLDGRFWSRSWVNQRAPRDKMKAEYPMLFMENTTAMLECLGEQDLTYEWFFMIIDKIPCESCPPNVTRTSEQVKQNVLWMLRSFLEELSTYQLWELEYPDAPTTRYEWISKGRRDYYEQNFEELQISLIDYSQEMSVLIETEPIQLIEWGRHLNPGEHRAFYTKIRIRICEPIVPNFRYDAKPLPQLSTAICPTC